MDRVVVPLTNFNRITNWDIFIRVIDASPRRRQGPGGRSAFHPMSSLNVLVLRSHNGLADEQTQLWIQNRRSLHRLLGITQQRNGLDVPGLHFFPLAARSFLFLMSSSRFFSICPTSVGSSSSPVSFVRLIQASSSVIEHFK